MLFLGIRGRRKYHQGEGEALAGVTRFSARRPVHVALERCLRAPDDVKPTWPFTVRVIMFSH